MERRTVPVSMGSPRFTTHELPGCLVTVAWFPPDTLLDTHLHERPTFAVMLAGGLDVRFTAPAIRRSLIDCPEGTIHTEPAGERHANQVGPRGAKVAVLQPDISSGRLPKRCLAMLSRINHFRDGPIAALGRGIARELASPDDVTPLAVEGLALETLAEASRLEVEGPRPSETPQWLARATEMMHDRFRENLKLSDIAAAADINVAHLAGAFRRVHRMPPAAYMRRLRVDWAAERLDSTELPISAVALEAGFADQAHLTRWFKRVTGQTPAAYRRSRRRGRSPQS